MQQLQIHDYWQRVLKAAETAGRDQTKGKLQSAITIEDLADQFLEYQSFGNLRIKGSLLNRIYQSKFLDQETYDKEIGSGPKLPTFPHESGASGQYREGYRGEQSEASLDVESALLLGLLYCSGTRKERVDYFYQLLGQEDKK